MERMEKFISKIAKDLNDNPRAAGKVGTLNQDVVANNQLRSGLRKRNDEFKKPKVYMTSEESAGSSSTLSTAVIAES